MKTLIMYDVAQQPVRARVDRVLREYGCTFLFRNARCSAARLERARLARDLRQAVAGEAYRILILEMGGHRIHARWLLGSPHRKVER